MVQNKQKVKIRNSSIELLRIIAMIMVIFHHFGAHGGFEWDKTSSMITRFWYNFIVMGGKIGVDVFVFITGYYLIKEKESIFNISKILKLWGQIFFYSVVIFIIFIFFGNGNLDTKSFIKVIFPITLSQWWFASTYFVLYLIHPFINKLLRSINKFWYQKLILLFVICWSIIPTFTMSLYQSNDLLWFITLYSISGYIRLYGLNNRFTTKFYLSVFILLSALTYASSVIFTILGNRWGIFLSYVTYFYGQEKITVLVISLCLFMCFATLKINYHKWINILGSATFGVYLIHDSKIVRQFLWTELFKNAQYQESILLIPYSMLVVAIVYVVCSLIELLRQHIIEKPFMMLVNHYSSQVIILLRSGISFLSNLVFGE